MRRLVRILVVVNLLISLSFVPAFAATPCQEISFSVSPGQTTYPANSPVTLSINSPSINDSISLYFIRTSQDLSNGNNWTAIPLNHTAGSTAWSSSWSPPSSLPSNSPYDSSNYQEFLLAFNVFRSGQFVCTGNPQPGSSLQSIICPNCRQIISTALPQEPNALPAANFYNHVPGYSITFSGNRYDQPLEDNSQPADGHFTTRFEYEAPIEICSGISVVPQRITKSNRWGYWGPAKSNPSDRVNIWTDGLTTIRQMISATNLPSPWDTNSIGMPYFKIYRPTSLSLTTLGTLTRTYRNTSLSFENLYYPPYLLTLNNFSQNQSQTFTRIDSIFNHPGTEDRSIICQPQAKNNQHHWLVRSTPVSQPEVLNQFAAVIQKFGQHPIVNQAYFESYGDGLNFREDWFLMQNVGVIGISQAFFPTNSALSSQYYYVPYMLPNTSTPPHLVMTMDRAYLGEPLAITQTPSYLSPGGTYTLRVVSANTQSPYDGYLDVDLNPPSIWRGFDNQPIWINNGQVSITLPTNFPHGVTTVRFRAHITQGDYPNAETTLNYNVMPWSNYITQTVGPPVTLTPIPSNTPVPTSTPTSSPPSDPDQDGDIDFLDLIQVLQNSPTIYSYNTLLSAF